MSPPYLPCISIVSQNRPHAALYFRPLLGHASDHILQCGLPSIREPYISNQLSSAQPELTQIWANSKNLGELRSVRSLDSSLFFCPNPILTSLSSCLTSSVPAATQISRPRPVCDTHWPRKTFACPHAKRRRCMPRHVACGAATLANRLSGCLVQSYVDAPPWRPPGVSQEPCKAPKRRFARNLLVRSSCSGCDDV